MPTLTIRGHAFSVSDKYAAGHVLTSIEASALNGLRTENIRNSMLRRTARFELNERGHMLKAGDVLKARGMVEVLDAEYTFGAGKPVQGSARLTQLALELATQQVDADCIRQGLVLDSDGRRAVIASIAESPAVLEEAARRAGLGRDAAQALIQGARDHVD